MCGQPRFVALYLLSTECSSYKDQRLMPTERKRQSYLVTTPRHVRHQHRGTATCGDALHRGLAGKLNQVSLCCN